MSRSDLVSILVEARKVIVTKGWCRMRLSQSGKVCALGAINKAMTGNPEKFCDNATISQLYRLFAKAVGQSDDCFSLVMWNDWRPGLNQTKVLAAFDKAIELARVA